MTTPFKNDYAFGLAVHTVNGHRLMEHDGGIDGFDTDMAYYPEDKLTVVVLGNLNGDAPEEIAIKLAAVALTARTSYCLPSERQVSSAAVQSQLALTDLR